MYLGQVKITAEWAKLEDLIKAQIYGQSEFVFDATKRYLLQCKSPHNFLIDEFVRLPSESAISAGIGESSGITDADVDKEDFETKIKTSGEYTFDFTDSTISADVGESTGITEASVVKETFEGEITTTGTYNFIFSESSASASIGESVGITGATVDKATFETLITTTGNYAFAFDGSDWKLGEDAITLADYGIVATGTPQSGYTITIDYVQSDWRLDSEIVSLVDYGITYVGTVADGDIITIDYTAKIWELGEVIIDLTDYGITFTGTAVDGDTIIISYIQSELGEVGNEISEREHIEYKVDTDNNTIVCVRAKNNPSMINIDVLEEKNA